MDCIGAKQRGTESYKDSSVMGTTSLPQQI